MGIIFATKSIVFSVWRQSSLNFEKNMYHAWNGERFHLRGCENAWISYFATPAPSSGLMISFAPQIKQRTGKPLPKPSVEMMFWGKQFFFYVFTISLGNFFASSPGSLPWQGFCAKRMVRHAHSFWKQELKLFGQTQCGLPLPTQLTNTMINLSKPVGWRGQLARF